MISYSRYSSFPTFINYFYVHPCNRWLRPTLGQIRIKNTESTQSPRNSLSWTVRFFRPQPRITGQIRLPVNSDPIEKNSPVMWHQLYPHTRRKELNGRLTGIKWSSDVKRGSDTSIRTNLYDRDMCHCSRESVRRY